MVYQTSTLDFTAQDINHQPINGLTVAFEVTNFIPEPLSAVTENNGVYSAKLSGTVAGFCNRSSYSKWCHRGR